MATLIFRVGRVYCHNCVLGVGKFLGKIKGVQSVSVKNNDSAVIEYDPETLEFDEARFEQIARETIERLGFSIKEY
jgi:copper chaperone CopZ